MVLGAVNEGAVEKVPNVPITDTVNINFTPLRKKSLEIAHCRLGRLPARQNLVVQVLGVQGDLLFETSQGVSFMVSI